MDCAIDGRCGSDSLWHASTISAASTLAPPSLALFGWQRLVHRALRSASVEMDRYVFHLHCSIRIDLTSIQISVATLTFAWLILIFLVCIIGFALPWFRSASHDSFERIHRFAGWTATALVWVHVVLLTNDWRGDKSLGYALVHSAPMWLMFIITGMCLCLRIQTKKLIPTKASLALPWTRLRKVSVRSVVLSDHAVRMYFQYKGSYH